MTLTACFECGNKISDSAVSCPGCGNIKTEAFFKEKDNREGETGLHSTSIKVVVSNFDMSFSSMVNFMVKWVLASIPAFIILAIIGVTTWTIIMMLL